MSKLMTTNYRPLTVVVVERSRSDRWEMLSTCTHYNDPRTRIDPVHCVLSVAVELLLLLLLLLGAL